MPKRLIREQIHIFNVLFGPFLVPSPFSSHQPIQPVPSQNHPSSKIRQTLRNFPVSPQTRRSLSETMNFFNFTSVSRIVKTGVFSRPCPVYGNPVIWLRNLKTKNTPPSEQKTEDKKKKTSETKPAKKSNIQFSVKVPNGPTAFTVTVVPNVWQ